MGVHKWRAQVLFTLKHSSRKLVDLSRQFPLHCFNTHTCREGEQNGQPARTEIHLLIFGVFYYCFCECLLCSEHSTDVMELRPSLPSLGNTLTNLERIRPCDTRFLASEAVEGTSLAFQGVDDNHGCGSLSLGMLGVGDGITMTFSRKTFRTPRVSS